MAYIMKEMSHSLFTGTRFEPWFGPRGLIERMAPLLCMIGMSVQLLIWRFQYGTSSLMPGLAIPAAISWAAMTALAIAVCTLLVFRHAHPLPVLVALLAIYAAIAFTGINGDLFFIAVCVALYALISRAGLKEGLVGSALTFCAMCCYIDGRMPPWYIVGGMVQAVIYESLVIMCALAIRGYRGMSEFTAREAEQRERARWLAAQRDEAVRRSHIASELHDSVGHGLTTIIALSEGLRGTIRSGATTPETAEDVIASINTVARESLGDTREAVRLLSRPQPSAAETTTTANVGRHSWDDIDGIITHVRQTGIAVVFTETGRRNRTDAQQADCCFAISREALTNTVRHGHAVNRITLSWDHDDDGGTMVHVRDDGGAGSAVHDNGGVGNLLSSGTGLASLRSWVERAGGWMRYGMTATGWEVTAYVPAIRSGPDETINERSGMAEPIDADGKRIAVDNDDVHTTCRKEQR